MRRSERIAARSKEIQGCSPARLTRRWWRRMLTASERVSPELRRQPLLRRPAKTPAYFCLLPFFFFFSLLLSRCRLRRVPPASFDLCVHIGGDTPRFIDVVTRACRTSGSGSSYSLPDRDLDLIPVSIRRLMQRNLICP